MASLLAVPKGDMETARGHLQRSIGLRFANKMNSYGEG